MLRSVCANRNLLNAAGTVADAQSKDKGAMLAMNNQISAARYVTKTHTVNIETFNSGDFGFTGEVYPDRVIDASSPLRRQYIPIKTETVPPVEIVPVSDGADGMALRSGVDCEAKASQCRP